MANFEALAEALKRKIKGQVSFDDARRALYSMDASNYRQVPIGVVVPRGIDDVLETLRLARDHGAPVLTRGAGTSLAGQCCNVALVIDFSRHVHRILEILPKEKLAVVEPGVVLDDLRLAARPHGLTFGPDPATHNRCTLGGMLGNNACGVHSVVSGKTVDNTESMEIATYDGVRMKVGATSEAEYAEILKSGGRRAEIYRALRGLRDKYADLIHRNFPKIGRRVSGYNLDELLPERGFNVARALVGSEGTCATILNATVRLIEDFPARVLVAAAYPDLYSACDEVPFILSHKPSGLEGLDLHFVRNMQKAGLHLGDIAMLPEGEGWLLVEFGARSTVEAEEKARGLMEALTKRGAVRGLRLFKTAEDQKRVWSVRESSFGATVFVPGTPDTYSGFEDSAVPPESLGAYMRELGRLLEKHGYYAVTYGHFGDGCVHSRISFDLRSSGGIQKYRVFQEEAADLVVRYGGSLSGEHGDGQTWGPLLHKMFGPELVEAFREFKRIWDPQGRMNPGKVVDSYAVEENLRLKAYSTIVQPALQFSYAQENGNFARMTERCIGIGKCLKKDDGVMCPSYMVTRDEMHSTRGRAHLLHEMMRGEVIKDGFRNEGVREALDLCLACKACKSECPVHVDMASYKAEFLAHHYAGRLRPLAHYVLPYISKWAHLGSKMPQIANFFSQNPVLGGMAKRLLGLAPQRTLPAFAPQTFRAWFEKRGPQKIGGREILFWPDTFSNYFYPEAAVKAVEVLEHFGFQIRLPQAGLCCGRPFYDFGLLGPAKDYLRRILKALPPGAPIVGLEPSCVAVFRDELTNLFPLDEAAKTLSRNTFLFSEFLEANVPAASFPELREKSIVHVHCHQKSVLGFEAEKNVLEKMKMAFQVLDSGCCGMAGAFGLEEKHQEVSFALASRVLLPAVLACSPETRVLANGFSCREQIAQLSHRPAFHLAEILHTALFSRR